MATSQSRAAARIMISPSVILLFLWMVVPLGLTIYFSFLRYNLLRPERLGWYGVKNYYYFFTDFAFAESIGNKMCIRDSHSLVVGIAAGTQKINAIKAALKGNIINALVTDEPTARKLL